MKARGLTTPQLIISDANARLIAAIREGVSGASGQRCKVHFMRNILAHIPQRDKNAFAAEPKEVWLAPGAEIARKRAAELVDNYEYHFSKVIKVPGGRAGKFAGLLCFSAVGFPEDFIFQYVGTAQ